MVATAGGAIDGVRASLCTGLNTIADQATKWIKDAPGALTALIASISALPTGADIAKLLAVMPDTDLASGPEAVRAGMRAAAAAQTTPPPFVAAVEDIEVMGGEGPIAARVYRPTAGPAPTITAS